jgi:hypothetical protein
MSKWYKDEEEWYPVLMLVGREMWPGCYGQPREFTDDEIADLRRVEKEFNEWQKKIGERFSKPHFSDSPFTLVSEEGGQP